jgi:acetyltransferase-like isoleucine patch superfamily enzyme
MLVFKIINFIIKHYKVFELKHQNKALIKLILSRGGILGSHVKFGRNVVISGSSSIKIGNNVHFGTGGFIRADGGLTIGDNVIISRNVVLYTSSHDYQGKLLPFDSENIYKPVVIEDNVWIGMNVTISPGTVIREGAIIGLGSRIFGEVPSRAIIGSGEINIIGYRNKEHYRSLKNLKKFCKENGGKY